VDNHPSKLREELEGKMVNKKIIFVALVLSISIHAEESSAGNVYKCIDTDGNITFSDARCPSDTANKQELEIETNETSSRSRYAPKLRNARNTNQHSIGLTYKQVAQYLDRSISMSKSSDVGGQPRYMGQSSDGLAILEIIGDKNDISQATIMIGVPNDSHAKLISNTALLVRFIKNIDPAWGGGADWAASALQNASSTGNPQSTVRGNKLIKLSTIKSVGLVSLTVKHRDKD
jgi:hypothetical protein